MHENPERCYKHAPKVQAVATLEIIEYEEGNFDDIVARNRKERRNCHSDCAGECHRPCFALHVVDFQKRFYQIGLKKKGDDERLVMSRCQTLRLIW